MPDAPPSEPHGRTATPEPRTTRTRPDARTAPLRPHQTPAAGRTLRVVVADDNQVVRAGLSALLSARPGIRVVAEAGDGHRALAATRHHRPDVVLLDVRMPGVDGLAALPHLVRLAPVLMLTYSRERDTVQRALGLGAVGYLVHGEFTADQLARAVRDAHEGHAHLTPSARNALLAHLVAPAAPHRPPVSNPPTSGETPSRLQSPVGESNRAAHGLSSREVEVMELIASGMSNQQIAATCFISEKTVKNHINRIFAKLHAPNRSAAIATWLGIASTGRTAPR
ncbi:response regulator transcription factor [Streptomyces albidoflavus]|uniref:response regulator transcription factor n=1 Tax=Streptomyces TaxID=1883 RepID=UPI0002830E28|nr:MULTISPECIES: response regulator transcription factor [Streptomyces]MYX53104.1 response regulator [Streptomyces sp. SID8385]KUL61243.1 two-component system response regulator [Streptomyces albidoflavus]MCO6750405.1 response regulator transcription factor [Streptomyces sp. IpFD-1.1]PKA36620.1 DNA-binding response regulator [Streptomyces sp. SM8]RZE75745.1 DNA-binding response regulator [Streptomyces albidoflavus]